MKFSVVIPLYNKAPYIKRAIDSVLNQTCQDFEIIVVDDGSIDGGGDIVLTINDPRITLIRQENAGESAARNKGISIANSEFIAFLDADDEWKETFLEEIKKLYLKFPNCGAYATSYLIINEREKKEIPVLRKIPKSRHSVISNVIRVLQYCLPFNASSIMIPKHILNNINGFPLGVSRGEDLITWIKIGLNYPIAFSREPLAIYHREAVGRVCNTYHVKPGFTDRQIFLKNLLAKKSLDKKQQKDLYDLYVKSLLDSAKTAIAKNDRDSLNLFLKEARGNNRYLINWCMLKAVGMISFNPYMFINRLRNMLKD